MMPTKPTQLKNVHIIAIIELALAAFFLLQGVLSQQWFPVEGFVREFGSDYSSGSWVYALLILFMILFVLNALWLFVSGNKKIGFGGDWRETFFKKGFHFFGLVFQRTFLFFFGIGLAMLLSFPLSFMLDSANFWSLVVGGFFLFGALHDLGWFSFFKLEHIRS